MLVFYFILVLFGNTAAEIFKGNHTNNWAVLVCTSRYWFNYRHVANALSIYRSIKRLGIPDSHIILMLGDEMPCNPRNPRPATVFNNANQHINVYGNDVEVDYKGYEVTAENLVRILTGRVHGNVPRSKQLISDKTSNVLIYLTGHGGDGFLKFQESEEISSIELADAFHQMFEKGRYNELLLLADTCQAASLYKDIYSPNILAAASSRVGEDSLSHHDDATLGVPIIDRWTYYLLQFLENLKSDTKKTMQDFFDQTSSYHLVKSHPTVRKDLFSRLLNQTLLTDFFGNVHSVKITPELKILDKFLNESNFFIKSKISNKPRKNLSYQSQSLEII
ncbi:GPI-anchor transamidase [Hydra vulgaris]|nr:GPI-anchor transamidase [Hydra vulgaris]